MWVKIFTQLDEAMKQLPDGKPRLVLVNDYRMAMVRKGEQFFAVDDYCTHNKESLSKGHTNFRNEIICPWHNYCFDLRTGRESQQRSADLTTYAVKLTADGLFVELPDEHEKVDC
jgi:3-phenylpropionate/trans-cinnamate dioxygenase ferredoxin component